MSSAINSTDAISMKNYLIDSLSRLSTITPTLGRKFIDGHHADNHKYNISLQELLNTKKQIKEHLSFSSDDWIKSSVKSNFDFFLDQYKYSICAKQKDIKLAIKEIEEYYNQTL